MDLHAMNSRVLKLQHGMINYKHVITKMKWPVVVAIKLPAAHLLVKHQHHNHRKVVVQHLAASKQLQTLKQPTTHHKLRHLKQLHHHPNQLVHRLHRQLAQHLRHLDHRLRQLDKPQQLLHHHHLEQPLVRHRLHQLQFKVTQLKQKPPIVQQPVTSLIRMIVRNIIDVSILLAME